MILSLAATCSSTVDLSRSVAVAFCGWGSGLVLIGSAAASEMDSCSASHNLEKLTRLKMAEAHSAVAFQFTITHEGIDVNVNHEALKAVFESGKISWKKKWIRFRNHLQTTTYPASPASWLAVVIAVAAMMAAHTDPSMGLIGKMKENLPSGYFDPPTDTYACAVLFATLAWLVVIYTLRYTIKFLLTYRAWMYEPRGRTSLATKLWTGTLNAVLLLVKKPKLYSFQSGLPNLPLPRLEDTTRKHLESVRGFLDDEEYAQMVELSDQFERGLGKRLQRYLWLKWLWSQNYVSDWWEEYVYLKGRSPLIINSNFYGIGNLFSRSIFNQAARAASITQAALAFRRNIDRENLKPIMMNNIIPLCSWQYERLFNTTRIPGIDTDKLMTFKDTAHIAVLHRGRWFKLNYRQPGTLNHLKPCELERQYQHILDNTSEPYPGEERLGALTAGERIPWAQARQRFFRTGPNKASLDLIEKSAFIIILDENTPEYDQEDHTQLDSLGSICLHGKGYDRWFDKSLCYIIFKNGNVGFNCEHSLADAPISSHMWEYILSTDLVTEGRFDKDGHCAGVSDYKDLPPPSRLKWDIPAECMSVIEASLGTAQALLQDTDLHIMIHNAYGKGFMKKTKTSPDAYLQMAMQLAYYRDAGKFNLTYEASMTRLFREGRTETVRPCSIQSCAFVKAMDDPSISKDERKKLFKKAADKHVESYRDAMSGRGIDRHLFCLYVVSKYLEVDSPFLNKVLSEPWRLSTSQTPSNQGGYFKKYDQPEYICGGGGFGPVADDGYGISYIIVGEDLVFFHISCKHSSPKTNAKKFGERIQTALQDIREMFSEAVKNGSGKK